MEEGKGSGYGKTILFGEHFVVHGIPAIASGISLRTTALVKPAEKYILQDDRPETLGYKDKKMDMQKDSMQRIFKEFDFNPEENPVKIVLGGDLIAMSGIGGSGASCVAIARALNAYLERNLSDEEINKIGYEGEKGYHGNPSGLDNTVSTYGSLIWFKRQQPENLMERISLKEPVEVVIGNTGKVANTKAAVAGVKERKEKFPEKYAEIFKQAEALSVSAIKALEEFDLQEVGRLMNENHKLLQEIEVSSPELGQLVEIARTNGALGAKMTGGGLGGVMLALTPGKELQEKVASAMEAAGFKALRTAIGMK